MAMVGELFKMEKKINQINVLRKQMDGIDNKIFLLLKKRFSVSKKIGRLKKENRYKIQDKIREKEIVKNAIKKNNLNRKFIEEFYRTIFKESRRVQR